MGISGLLPILRPIMEDAHIRDFAGQIVGVDAFSWLHKGAIACSYELCMDIPTDKYVKFCMSRVEMMLAHRVVPVLIFDGHPMKMKSCTNVERSKIRRTQKKRGMALAQQGNRTAATECFQKGVDITADMTHQLQLALKEAGVDFVVAPYEADVQLAYMSLNGLVDCVVTEDSDLIVYGSKRVLYKLDKHGCGQLLLHQNLGAVENPSLLHFSRDMFLHMCVLAGCDFLPSINGMGVKKAHMLILTHKTMDKVFRAIRSNPNYVVPEDYVERFWKAVATFNHARAYDPTAKMIRCLRPLPATMDESLCDFLGAELNAELASGVAEGRLNPRDYEPYRTTNAQKTLAKKFSRLQDRVLHSNANSNRQSKLTFSERCEPKASSFAAAPAALASEPKTTSVQQNAVRPTAPEALSTENPFVRSQAIRSAYSPFFAEGSGCLRQKPSSTSQNQSSNTSPLTVHESPQPLGSSGVNKRPMATDNPVSRCKNSKLSGEEAESNNTMLSLDTFVHNAASAIAGVANDDADRESNRSNRLLSGMGVAPKSSHKSADRSVSSRALESFVFRPDAPGRNDRRAASATVYSHDGESSIKSGANVDLNRFWFVPDTPPGAS